MSPPPPRIFARKKCADVVDLDLNAKENSDGSRHARLLILVDESNVGSSVRTAGRGLDG
jgi:hypothetical protein